MKLLQKIRCWIGRQHGDVVMIRAEFEVDEVTMEVFCGECKRRIITIGMPTPALQKGMDEASQRRKLH